MYNNCGIAIDIGTSGIRIQGVDLDTSEVIATSITLRHPLPGANVVDHLHFALKVGGESAHNILIEAINKVINSLNIDKSKIRRVSVCGNPIQLSLFNNIEIRDLAYWGENAIRDKHIVPPSRKSKILKASDVDLDLDSNTEVYIPPAIKHEIGADALAMLYKSGTLEKDGIFLIIDFGTNAEMALVMDGEIYTCSAAAGPAIEGQMIKKGRLASPETICDLDLISNGWKMKVLNDELITVDGDVVNPNNGKIMEKSNIKTEGITGTGVIAAFSLGIRDNIIQNGQIKSGEKIYLQDDVYLSQNDIVNIGKALGAFRAAYLTLAETAGIDLDEIDSCYMAGASGFYVDPLKSLDVGQIPPSSYEIYQLGNTSLSMAKDICLNPELLNTLQSIADNMESNHVMLATSEIFKNIYSLELAVYEQGMPLWMYNQWLDKYGYQQLPKKEDTPIIHKLFERDIPEIGEKLNTVEVGSTLKANFEGCIQCSTCIDSCPENAIKLDGESILLKTDLCAGLGCQKCVLSCPLKVYDYSKFLNF